MNSRMVWQDIGIETIPLWKGRKIPVLKGWNDLNPSFQWSRVAEEIRWNIGCRSGNGISFIDCDDAPTVGVVEDKLSSLGLEPLSIETLRGKHYYLRLQGIPEGFNISKLSIGSGELRCNRSFVVAPNSIVKGFQYEIIRGSPKSFLRQPVIDWDDLLWLLPKAKRVTRGKLSTPPIPLLKRDVPPRVWHLVDVLSRGELDKYQSKSELECAIVTILILQGWSFNEIKSFFGRIISKLKAHYSSKGKHKGSYLKITFSNALLELTSSPCRKAIASYYQNDLTFKNDSDRNVFKALLSICWQWNNWTIHASTRDIAQLSGFSQTGVWNALNRLQRQGAIELLARGTYKGKKASLWRVGGCS